MSKKSRLNETLSTLDPTRPAFTALNPDGLSIDQRMPSISQRLLIVERLLEAARQKGSGALPGADADDEEWFDWFSGLQQIVRDARRIAEDCFELASFGEER